MIEYRERFYQLVPKELTDSLQSSQLTLPDLSHNPHLQRFAGLVFYFLHGKERSYSEGNINLKRTAENVLNKPSPESEFDLPFDKLVHSEWRTLYLTLEKRDRNLHMLITRELNLIGNPFGFDLEVTSAILEMANYAHEYMVHELSRGSGVEIMPSPTEMFPAVLLDIFEEHRDNPPMTLPDFNKPRPSRFLKKIFPLEVAEQIRQLIA